MDWFLKLDSNVQCVAVVGACLVLIVVVVNLRLLVQRPATLSYRVKQGNTDFEQAWEDLFKSIPKVNEGSFHTAHYTVETKETPKPPKGGSGTAPPKLRITRHYIVRDDGRFFSTGIERWGPKASATHWGDIADARRCCQELMDAGTKDVRLLSSEVEA